MERGLAQDVGGELRLVGSSGGAGTAAPRRQPGRQPLLAGADASRRGAYVVFVQLQDAAGKPWALAETPDLGNGYTLDQLGPGEPVRAQYSLLLPATAPGRRVPAGGRPAGPGHQTAPAGQHGRPGDLVELDAEGAAAHHRGAGHAADSGRPPGRRGRPAGL